MKFFRKKSENYPFVPVDDWLEERSKDVDRVLKLIDGQREIYLTPDEISSLKLSDDPTILWIYSTEGEQATFGAIAMSGNSYIYRK